MYRKGGDKERKRKRENVTEREQRGYYMGKKKESESGANQKGALLLHFNLPLRESNTREPCGSRHLGKETAERRA